MGKARQQNGKGSVFQVSEYKWIAKISMGIRPDGRPMVKQFSGKTEAAAKKKLRDFKNSIDFAEKHIPNTDTVHVYFSRWLKEYQYPKLKPLSYDRLESTVKNHIIPNLGALKINRVTRDQIQALINKLYFKQELSYSSIKKVYDALNACYKHAIIAGDVLKNPCLGITLPSSAERTTQITALSAEEVNKLKAELQKTAPDGKPLYYYSNAFLLILNTGLRMNEALSLQWSDIDFANRVLSVSKNNILAKNRDENGDAAGGYYLTTQNSVKTASGFRRIPINQAAEKALKALRRNNPTPYVIVNNCHKLVLSNNFERAFQTILKNADLPRMGVHSLRHTFASMMFSKNVDIKIVSQLLGHASVKITYDTYIHILEKDIKHVTNVLDYA